MRRKEKKGISTDLFSLHLQLASMTHICLLRPRITDPKSISVEESSMSGRHTLAVRIIWDVGPPPCLG